MRYMNSLIGKAARTFDNPFTRDELRQIVPSVFSYTPSPDRGDGYAQVPTIDVLDTLKDIGFEPFYAVQQNKKNADDLAYARHMLRLRHRDDFRAKDSTEIVLVNSHDGTSSVSLMLGEFRMVCANGIIAGNVEHSERIRHTGSGVLAAVTNACHNIYANRMRMTDTLDAMRGTAVTQEAKEALGWAAASIKYGNDDEQGTIHGGISQSKALTLIRRRTDVGDSLYTIFQVVQENLIRGGTRYHDKDGVVRKMRPVNSITEGVRINKAWWAVCEKALLTNGFPVKEGLPLCA